MALADGARRARRRRSSSAPGSPASTCATAACTGVVTDEGTIRADVVVNAGGMYAPQIARMVGVTVPIVPMAHEYLVTEPFEPRARAAPDAARPRPAGLLPRGGRRPGRGRLRAQPGAVGARRGARRLRGQLLPERLGALRADCSRTRSSGCRRWRRPRSRKLDQRPRGVHARRRVHPRGVATCPGFWVAAGFCAHGLAGAGGMGWQMAEWIVDGEPEPRPVAHGHPPLRRASTAAAATRSRGPPRSTRPTTTSGTRTRSARPGRPLRLSPAYARARELGAVLRREVGLGAGELVRAERGRAATRRLRPRGLGGPELVAGDRRRGARDPRARRGSSTRRSFAKIEVRGPRRARLPAAAVRERRRQAGRAPSPTRRC